MKYPIQFFIKIKKVVTVFNIYANNVSSALVTIHFTIKRLVSYKRASTNPFVFSLSFCEALSKQTPQ